MLLSNRIVVDAARQRSSFMFPTRVKQASTLTRLFHHASSSSSSASSGTANLTPLVAVAATGAIFATVGYGTIPKGDNDNRIVTPFVIPQQTTACEAARRKSKSPSSDILMLSPTKEPSTGILFPRLCNSMTFVGCGVRVKWGFVKVYAVGTYVDPTAFSAVKKEGDAAIDKALLDPMYPRVIRIVMNRSLSMDKYTNAIVEALKPRMNGQDLEKLDEFQKLNPPGDLVEGAEMVMTIHGDSMLYKNSAGAVGAITSEVFCRAMCDVYYGKDPVSPVHKEKVIEGIKKL